MNNCASLRIHPQIKLDTRLNVCTRNSSMWQRILRTWSAISTEKKHSVARSWTSTLPSWPRSMSRPSSARWSPPSTSCPRWLFYTNGMTIISCSVIVYMCVHINMYIHCMYNKWIRYHYPHLRLTLRRLPSFATDWRSEQSRRWYWSKTRWHAGTSSASPTLATLTSLAQRCLLGDLAT